MAHHDLVLMLYLWLSVRVDVLPDHLPDLWPSELLGKKQCLVLLHRLNILRVCACVDNIRCKAFWSTVKHFDTRLARSSSGFQMVVEGDST